MNISYRKDIVYPGAYVVYVTDERGAKRRPWGICKPLDAATVGFRWRCAPHAHRDITGDGHTRDSAVAAAMDSLREASDPARGEEE